MFAVYARNSGGNDPLDALTLGEVPEPPIREGWVKVRMSAVSLNNHDLSTLRGVFSSPDGHPVILGCDGVGTLEDGTPVVIYPVAGSDEWKGDETLDPGRYTFGEQMQGTMAEYAFVPKRNAVPLPAGISTMAAATLGAAWSTAYRMLFTLSGLRAGQTMLVQGGSGGVATALIQMGRAAGMRVWVTGRSEQRLALARTVGAHRTFLSNEALPEPVDAVFDPVGAATFPHSLASAKTGGTVVVCGIASGNYPPLDLLRVFVEQITIKGVFASTLDEFRNMLTFVQTAGIDPHVGQVLPVREVGTGVQMMLEGRQPGKIVVTL